MSIATIPVEHLSYEWMGEAQDTLLSAEAKHVIFTVGVSASGKTTWAESFAENNPDWMIICRDNFRASICRPFSWAAWKKLGSKAEKEVNHLQAAWIQTAIDRRANVIICDTNLNPKNFNHLVDVFKHAGYKIYFKFFPVDWKTAVERDNARPNGVGVSVLAQQFEKIHAFQYKREREFIQGANGGMDAVLCDIDGTLAHMTTRGPYDYDQVSTDSVDLEVLEILNGMFNQGYQIVIVSGRDGICKEDTYNWLLKHLGKLGIFFYHYQRAVRDKRPDDVIKTELLDQIIQDGFNPKMVFDDRPRVARKWRALGLKVFQVGNPYIEF